jgi:FkbM family methyltransferase
MVRFWVNRLFGRATDIRFAPLDEAPLKIRVRSRRELRRTREVKREGPLLRRMLDAVGEEDVLYDIGANIGVLSVILGRRTGGRAFAFEPEPRNFESLVENLRINGLDGRVEARRLALGDEVGEVELFVRGEAGEGRHSIAASEGSTGSIRVPLTTVSHFARETGVSPDVVKIDVEGAEGRVLAGMEALIRERPPREIFLELHAKGEHDQVPGPEPSTVDEWLTARGYVCAWADPRGPEEHRHYRQ